MPNTLIHAGVQGFFSKRMSQQTDLKWVYFGAIIPDLPWILQRILHVIAPSIDSFALLSYATIQSSLFVSIFLCYAIASFTKKPKKLGLILSINVLIHLLLDASQIKWGNGVHLFSPFSWQQHNWGFFWPESVLNYILTGLGLLFLLKHGKKTVHTPINLAYPSAWKASAGIMLCICYFLLPLYFIQQPELANNHFMDTLGAEQERIGKPVACDRGKLSQNEGATYLTCWNGEAYLAQNIERNKPATVSIQGHFTQQQTIFVEKIHIHLPIFRDAASYIGLFLILAIWCTSLANSIRKD